MICFQTTLDMIYIPKLVIVSSLKFGISVAGYIAHKCDTGGKIEQLVGTSCGWIEKLSEWWFH